MSAMSGRPGNRGKTPAKFLAHANPPSLAAQATSHVLHVS